MRDDVATHALSPKYTLLYVEDNPANLLLVEQLIERRNDLKLLVAIDGHLGIKLARSKFDEDCVDALIFNAQKVKEIQTQFEDSKLDLRPNAALLSGPENSGA